MSSSTTVIENIPGYGYGRSEIGRSEISIQKLEALKISAEFGEEEELSLRRAGEVLSSQVKRIVEHWRKDIILSIPNLARHSQSEDGQIIGEYVARSNVRFEQWILDTCFRPYDQDWLDYQQEIALRHTSLKKNLVDQVSSTPYVPLRDVIAFSSVMNETIKPYLYANGDEVQEVERMHRAWCKSIQLQIAIWVKAYEKAGSEW